MLVLVQRTYAFAMLTVAASLCGEISAQAPATPAAVDDEITVRGKAIGQYRVELEEARENLIETFNDENSSEQDDVVCRKERPTGSRMPQTVCRSNAQLKAEAQSARWWLNSMVLSTAHAQSGSINSTIAAATGASDAVATTSASRDRIEEELRRLAQENQTLYKAALEFIEAEDAYNAARAEAAQRAEGP